jgi:hypothetical protein
MGAQTVETEETALDVTGVKQLEASLRGKLMSLDAVRRGRAGFHAMIDCRPALIARDERLSRSESHHEIGVLAHACAPSACQVGSNEYEEAAMSWQRDVNEAPSHRPHRCLEEPR